jgi:predicted enzyme related to lactoylglutathione lyase
MKRSIVHFELSANDVEKLAAFYRNVFDWEIEKTGEEGMEYWLINTGEGEGPNGGMMKKVMWRAATPSGIVDFFAVESVEEFSKKVASQGGKVLEGKQPVPAMGWFAICQDPEGNVLALWEMDPNAA